MRPEKRHDQLRFDVAKLSPVSNPTSRAKKPTQSRSRCSPEVGTRVVPVSVDVLCSSSAAVYVTHSHIHALPCTPTHETSTSSIYLSQTAIAIPISYLHPSASSSSAPNRNCNRDVYSHILQPSFSLNRTSSPVTSRT